jgi:hypothetical protein
MARGGIEKNRHKEMPCMGKRRSHSFVIVVLVMSSFSSGLCKIQLYLSFLSSYFEVLFSHPISLYLLLRRASPGYPCNYTVPHVQ